eukprot:scpid102773/ scgid25758/ 
MDDKRKVTRCRGGVGGQKMMDVKLPAHTEGGRGEGVKQGGTCIISLWKGTASNIKVGACTISECNAVVCAQLDAIWSRVSMVKKKHRSREELTSRYMPLLV